MRRLLVTALTLFLAVPLFAASADLTIPAFGHIILPHVTYRSELVITNHRDVEQLANVYMLGRSDFGHGFLRQIAIPPHESQLEENFLGFPGVLATNSNIGALHIVAIKSDGSPDPDARLDADAFVIAERPDGSTSRQEMPAVPAADYLIPKVTLAGIRHDLRAYTNVGIVNLGERDDRYLIVAGDQSFEVEVPAQTLVQVRLPFAPTAARSVTVHPYWAITRADPPPPPSPWIAYASSVDGASGDAWTALRITNAEVEFR